MSAAGATPATAEEFEGVLEDGESATAGSSALDRAERFINMNGMDDGAIDANEMVVMRQGSKLVPMDTIVQLHCP